MSVDNNPWRWLLVPCYVVIIYIAFIQHASHIYTSEAYFPKALQISLHIDKKCLMSNKIYELYHHVSCRHNTCLPSGHGQKVCHDDVIKRKHLPRYWPFVRGIHRSPVNSSHKGPVTWSFDVFFDLRHFSSICDFRKEIFFDMQSIPRQTNNTKYRYSFIFQEICWK